MRKLLRKLYDDVIDYIGYHPPRAMRFEEWEYFKEEYRQKAPVRFYIKESFLRIHGPLSRLHHKCKWALFYRFGKHTQFSRLGTDLPNKWHNYSIRIRHCILFEGCKSLEREQYFSPGSILPHNGILSLIYKREEEVDYVNHVMDSINSIIALNNKKHHGWEAIGEAYMFFRRKLPELHEMIDKENDNATLSTLYEEIENGLKIHSEAMLEHATLLDD